MKIMWIANLPLPEIAIKLGVRSNLGGWLIAISDYLKKQNDIDFVYCYPQKCCLYTIFDEIDGVKYYGFYEDLDSCEYDNNISTEISAIYNTEKPDVVHMFGTEYLHSYAAIKSDIDLNKLVLSIQGVITMIAQHFCEGISYKDRYHLYRNKAGQFENIESERKMFAKKSPYEKEIFRKLIWCEGRTDFDYACAKLFNPDINYFKCNRILRSEFYGEEMWDYDACEKNSIFLSQVTYPVKGFHVFLEALDIVKRRVPDVKVYIAGKNVFRGKKSEKTPYANYISNILKQKHLEKNLTFVGDLSAEKMKQRYLKSQIFVMPSVIENSPNSLGEAMILGVPCVASDVGGSCNMITHNSDGYIYRSNAIYLLANYIIELLGNRERCEKFSQNARQEGLEMFDKENNIRQIVNMYKTIMQN